MIHADGEIALLVAVHDKLLDGSARDLEGLGELGKALDELEIDRLVDLGELLEQAGKDDLLERSNVLLHLLVGANLGKNRGNLLANGQRVEVDLEDVVEIANLRTGTTEESLREHITEQAGASRRLRHAKKVGQARVLVLACLIKVDHGPPGPRSADDRDREGREDDESRGLLQVSLAGGGVIGLLALASRNHGGRLAQQVVVPRPSSGVEEVVLADQEDAGELLVVVRHHDVLGRPLAEAQQGVDILNAAESLLPQLQFDSHI
ncbi:hypothetical protein VTI74DRAFT_8266 [Chaetomium olivicolor]